MGADKSYDELKSAAKERGIKGYHRMSEDELFAALFDLEDTPQVNDSVKSQDSVNSLPISQSAPKKDVIIPFSSLPYTVSLLSKGRVVGIKVMGRVTETGVVIDDTQLI